MIKIGGVPEHFNYPWHQLKASGRIDMEWLDVKGGTGAMCRMLEAGDLDCAVVLTEGFIQHVHKGGKIQLVQQFVKSPLIWGVHARPGERPDLSTARIAVSRYGSGSHIMSYVHADNRGATLNPDQFVVVGNIDGAMEAFTKGQVDLLLWEKFMTQPYVDQGLVERVDQCVSPWPCFVLACHPEFAAKRTADLKQLSEAILFYAAEVMREEESIAAIANMYQLSEDQTAKWFHQTEWQVSPWVSTHMLNNVQHTLKNLELIEEVREPERFCVEGARLF
jgi:ABC-type nitrate/sulfonate/bicarbonate transport system substrate-binding protein